MTVLRGTCRLCREDRDLVESHILSAWVIRRVARIRSPTESRQAVEVWAGGEVVPQCAQLTEHLLCIACEGRIKKWEDRVADVAVQTNGHFPALERARVLAEKGEVPCVDLGEEAARFPASVFWRASVSTKYPDVSLGSYEERFRRYLLSDSSDLGTARLVVNIIDHNDLACVASHPHASNEGGYHLHQFTVPGLRFSLLVGARVPARFDAHCFFRTRGAWAIDGLDMVGMFADASRAGVAAGRLHARRR